METIFYGKSFADYLADHRVSYQERLDSLDKQCQMWEDLQHKADWNDWVKHYAEMVFENKRTMLREPATQTNTHF